MPHDPLPNIQNETAAGSNVPEHSAGIRVGHELLVATQPFAVESVRRSWWAVDSTFILLIATLTGAGLRSGSHCPSWADC
jgi:acyl-lipid omega-6 desaturase (Delta-12 desaturase)